MLDVVALAAALFEGLTAHDSRTLAVVPGLAKSWDISPDGMTYTFHLRDAKWSDGKEITASDVVYSVERVLRPETASQYSYMLWELPNAEAYTGGKLKVRSSTSSPVVVTATEPELSEDDIKSGKQPDKVKIIDAVSKAELGWVKPAELKGPEDGQE